MFRGGGHRSTSLDCAIKKRKEEELSVRFRDYIVSHKLYDTARLDFASIGEALNISSNKAKQLHKSLFESDPESFLNQEDEHLLDEVFSDMLCCDECGVSLPNIGNEMFRDWGTSKICNDCWFNHAGDRDNLWNQLVDYLSSKNEGGESVCNICLKSIDYGNYPYNRFYCDHLNGFEKTDSICNMVKVGKSIDDIISEVDKCQLVCYSCHVILTNLERRLPFSRLKTDLTKRLNGGKITLEEYNSERVRYGKIYEDRMVPLYDRLRAYRRRMV